ncbi:MAG: FAD-binding oxidoreductase [Chloroflexi bacterium]|nr:FAD-binding oxidoreductase [Chloroflexota bacterium]MBI2982831.1 FAD-binding oxidoreductase [Chloroflexota bacterium]
MTAVVRPSDVAACAAALGDAARDRRTVRISGAATKAYLGQLRATDMTLETAGMAGIVDHVPADLTVTVAAGTRLADLQRALGERGQFLPLDPPHGDAATIGGIVASGSEGFGRLRYGGVRDNLIGTVVALADGTIAHPGGRVVKNVAGYDLNKLLIGSLGTLGVIAEATFKVLPLPSARGLAVVRCSGPAAAFAVADALVRAPLRASALAVEGTARGWITYVEAQGARAQVERAMQEASRAAAAAGATAERTDDESALAPARELPGTAADGALVRVALPIGAQRSFAESASRLDPFVRLVADAGSGIVRVHLRGDDAAVLRAADTLLAGASVVGGSARVERRAPSLRERLGAWGGPRPGGDFLMRRIKDAFDPAGVLEPGRSVVG